MRIGTGYDVHRLTEGRKLILGGVEIPHENGLDGHSDADVLTHAVMDALAGAAGLGDIGRLFPDTDDAYKDISSIKLLKDVKKMLEEKLFVIENIDTTIVAQRPRLSGFFPLMKKTLAEALGIDEERVSVKATTEEHLGFTGREEGISAQAVCLLSYFPDDMAGATSGCGACPGCACTARRQNEQEDRT
ncbi:MAG: 2-C-methyl-D-erythritol 2,4-cyclodiphosphate synthase [Lachnospiraceae bacterium]|nr:2-C-methyl-D-erythritol 2,4-cyclodiphosphate synthase [Lachnospiraceae bacterium]